MEAIRATRSFFALTRHPGALAALATAVWLAAGAAAPTAAEASCGDYVLMGHHQSHQGVVLPDASSTTHDPASGGWQFSTDGSRRPLPVCRGARCQGRDSMPAPYRPLNDAAQRDLWGVLCSLSSAEEAELSWCLPEVRVAARAGYFPAIEHPPRPVSLAQF